MKIKLKAITRFETYKFDFLNDDQTNECDMRWGQGIRFLQFDMSLAMIYHFLKEKDFFNYRQVIIEMIFISSFSFV